MDLLLLCWEFLKIGLFSVGGGMATVPFLARMSQAYPHWFSLEMLADMIAVSESTPGPIGINMATYVGYTVGGIPGAVLATVSLALPAFIILLFLAQALTRLRTNRFVEATFRGLRPAVAGLIAAAGYVVFRVAMFQDGTLHFKSALLFVAISVCLHVKKLKSLHPAIYIGIAAVVGIALQL